MPLTRPTLIGLCRERTFLLTYAEHPDPGAAADAQWAARARAELNANETRQAAWQVRRAKYMLSQAYCHA